MTAYDNFLETRNEVARRNYALTTETFDCEHMLQIKCGSEIVVTVTQAAGPTVPSEFLVFNGNGLDSNDEDLIAIEAVKVVKVKGSVAEAWREAARFGYLHALGKLMTSDQREERDLYGMVG